MFFDSYSASITMPSALGSGSGSGSPEPALSSMLGADYSDGRSSATPTPATAEETSKGADATATASTGLDKEKPRLTEQEKKINHIASEQKRRAAIREGFDRLTELVPGLEGQGRSESVVLRKSVDFIHAKLQERQSLIREIEARGGRIDDSLRQV